MRSITWSRIRLTPLYPGRRSDVGGRTSDVVQGQCQEKFFMFGRMVGQRTAEKKRRKNFVLGSPTNTRFHDSTLTFQFNKLLSCFFLKILVCIKQAIRGKTRSWRLTTVAGILCIWCCFFNSAITILFVKHWNYFCYKQIFLVRPDWVCQIRKK